MYFYIIFLMYFNYNMKILKFYKHILFTINLKVE